MTVHVHDGGEAIVPDGRRLYAAETLRMTAWDADPAHAELDAHVVYRWQEREAGRDGELTLIEIRADARQTSTATDFDLAVRLEVDVDGARFFERDWSRAHPAPPGLTPQLGAPAHAAALDFGAMRPSRISAKAERFTESVIREMNRLAVAHGAVSLAQGFPDFACPPELKRAVAEAVDADINQYAITWGSKPLRDAIAETTPRHFPGWGEIDPETQVTVTCGATEAMIAAMLGLLDPGDEVIVFEPYYENYGPDAILSGATPRYVTLHEPDWSIDPDELRRAFNAKTRGDRRRTRRTIPTGKVFTRDELELIAGLCHEFDVIAFTDDIYEHLVFEGEHIPLATLPGMAERTVSIHSMSKTYSVTGWRIGWTIAPADLSIGIRRVHDFLTVGAAAPLQAAAVTALGFPPALLRRPASPATASGATSSSPRSRPRVSASIGRRAPTT